MKVFCTLLFTILIFGSCDQKSPKIYTLSSIDLSHESVKTVNLSEFCYSVDYILLETNTKCYINKIKKVKFFGDSIFVFNELGWNLGEILVFNFSGSFLFSFGQIGPGPEEIENPRDIIKFYNSFLLWDRRKVAEFDNAGKFKKKIFDAHVHGYEFFTESDNIYLYHGTEFPGILTKYGLDGSLIDTLKSTKSSHLNTAFENENVTFANGEHHLFAPAFDTVWTLINNNIIPRYYFDFKGETTLEKFFNSFTNKDPLERLSALNSTPISHVLTFLENDNYLFLKYIRSKKSSYKVINKINNRYLDFVTSHNDIDYGIFDNPITLTNEYLVIPLDPMKMKLHIKNNTKQYLTKFQEISESLKETDNPVLMLCKIRL